MMNIPINYQNAIRPVVNLSIAGRNRDIIEKAKAHCSIRSRMVSGWTYKRNGVR
jgi:hypothetical protein